MPHTVQTDFVAQLQSICKSSLELAVPRRSALYNLAMCSFVGFGVGTVDLNKALTFLLEAAQLGSPEALAIACRLHVALQGHVPAALWNLDHPAVEIEKELVHI